MKVENNKVVAVSYALEVEGKIADQSAPGAPLEYIHGTGMLLPKFETAVLDKEPGDAFDFILSPEDGYGVYDPAFKIDLPKTAFAIDGKIHDELLVVGRTIPMLNQAGQVVQGVVAAVTENAVTMDFNHPMAGKTLHFTGRVESVRSATDKELTEGLHGEYLPPEEHRCHGKGKGCGKGEGHCHDEGDCGCQEGGDCNCPGDGKDGDCCCQKN